MGQKFACVEGQKYPCNQYHFASQQLGVLKKKTVTRVAFFIQITLKVTESAQWIDNKIDNIKRLMV